MGWRDQLRKASYRGAEFCWADATTTLDPMVVVHKYPQRQGGWTEPLGLGPDEFEVVGYVIGPDYMTARDKLIKALKESGPGTLVHPTMGEKTVVLSQRPRIQESTREGGMARFSMVFTEEGENKYPEERAPATSGVADAAVAARAATLDDFAAEYDTMGLDLVEADAMGAVSEALSIIQAELGASALGEAAGLVGDAWGEAAGAYGTMTDRYGSLVARATGLLGRAQSAYGLLTRLLADPWAVVRDAVGLGDLLGSLVAALSTSLGSTSGSSSSGSDGATSSVATVGAVSALAATAGAVPVPAATTTSARQDLNRAALARLIRRQAAIAAAEVAAEGSYDSRDDAIKARDLAVATIDLARIDDGAVGQVFAALSDLRAATARALGVKAGSLARMRRVELGQAQPAAMVAWAELGDASRAAEIVSRNRALVWHPLFVPAGVGLEVLDDEVADA